jgi:hypothetical protein
MQFDAGRPALFEIVESAGGVPASSHGRSRRTSS